MEPALELPCQTVAFLQVPKNIACGIMKSMPTININYDVRKHDLLFMNNYATYNRVHRNIHTFVL